MPRGGKRPGAGAPRGNINALSSGRFSTRYSDAWLILRALPRVRQHIDDLYAASDPDARDQHRRYLEAAVWTADHFPELAEQLEEHISVYLTPRAAEVKGGAAILYMLEPPRDRRHPLQRALSLTIYLQAHDPVLAPILTDHLLSRYRIAPVLMQNSNFTQSNNQTIKATG